MGSQIEHSVGDGDLFTLPHCVSAAFSPHEDFIYLLAGQHIRCWDIKKRIEIGRALYNHYSGCSLHVSSDGKWIVAEDGWNLRVWDSQAFFWSADTRTCRNALIGPESIPEEVGDDGWIRTGEDELLLWVPEEYRESICDLSRWLDADDDDRRSIRILWHNLHHGSEWTKMYLPKTS